MIKDFLKYLSGLQKSCTQRRLITGLRLLSLERFTYEVHLSVVLIFGEFSPFSELLRMSHWTHTLYTSNVVYAEHVFSFWECRMWYMPGRGSLNDQLPIATLALKSSGSSLVDNISCVAKGIKHILYDSTGRRLLETCPSFPLNLASCVFSFC